MKALNFKSYDPLAPSSWRQWESPLGTLTLVARGAALSALYFPNQAPNLPTPAERQNPALQAACRWLESYFQGLRPHPAQLDLAPLGTPFQLTVWQLLSQLPYGETLTYAQLAQRVALQLQRSSMTPRAVGGALGRNPLPIILPCHRILAAQRRLGGFSGGLEVKEWLLQLEGISYRRS